MPGQGNAGEQLFRPSRALWSNMLRPSVERPRCLAVLDSVQPSVEVLPERRDEARGLQNYAGAIDAGAGCPPPTNRRAHSRLGSYVTSGSWKGRMNDSQRGSF